MIDSPTGRDLGDAADHADAGRHAGAVEVEIDLVGHDLGLLGDLARERARVLAGLVVDDGERRLEGMRQVADVGARALDDVLVGLEERVELLLQRLDLVGQVDIEPRRLAGADGGQALLHLGQRQQAEADLEQRDGEQADAGQRQGEREARADKEALVPSCRPVKRRAAG